MSSIISLITYISFASHVLASYPVAGKDDLSSYTQSIYLPYVSSFSAGSTPKVHGSIDGKKFNLSIDTGTTGVIIGAPLLPSVKDSDGVDNPGWEFLSSSSLLYIGRFVSLPIEFYGSKNAKALSSVPVLVVDKSLHCPWYNSKTDKGTCPPNKEKPTEKSTKKIEHMGVGFGRNPPGSNLPFAIPSHNPFLNINSIDGKKVTDKDYRNGYTVSIKGVWLGLTNDNTNNSAWVGLDKGTTDDSRDWAMMKMAFNVNGDGNYQGSALIDTGIPQMYIEATPGHYLPNVTVKNPTGSSPAYVKHVETGTELSFVFPNFENGAAGYDFQVGNMTETAHPSYVIPETISIYGGGAFVNTGRKFLYAFNVAFDAVGGQVGLQCKRC